MGFDWPATGIAPVTPSNSVNLAKDARALYVGVTGDLTVMATDSSVAIFLNVPVGIFPIQCRRIYATGTTATAIVALL